MKIRTDFMGVAPEEPHFPTLFLAWKAHGSTLHWERWAALRQLPSAWPPGLKQSTAWLSSWG